MKRSGSMESLGWIVGPCLFVLVVSAASDGALTVDSYSQTVGQIGQQELAYWQKVEALTAACCDDARNFGAFRARPRAYLDARLKLQNEFNAAKAGILNAAGATAAEYANFQAANQEAIKSYLANNPDVAAGLEAVSGEIAKLKAKLAVPSYCLLAVSHASYKILQMNDLIAPAQEYSGTKEAFTTQEKKIQKDWDAKLQTLFTVCDTSGKEYLNFASRNGEAMRQYLETHPFVKQSIDQLSAQMLKSVQQYEQLRDKVVNRPEPRPSR